LTDNLVFNLEHSSMNTQIASKEVLAKISLFLGMIDLSLTAFCWPLSGNFIQECIVAFIAVAFFCIGVLIVILFKFLFKKYLICLIEILTTIAFVLLLVTAILEEKGWGLYSVLVLNYFCATFAVWASIAAFRESAAAE
jgi:hypothetical protein